jgi:hypothetical protein
MLTAARRLNPSSLTDLGVLTANVALGVGVFMAAVQLFLLRRTSVVLLSGAVALSLALTALQVLRRISGTGRPVLYGCVLLVAALVYARRLGKRGVLS